MQYLISTKHYVCKSCGLSVYTTGTHGFAGKEQAQGRDGGRREAEPQKRIPEMVA